MNLVPIRVPAAHVRQSAAKILARAKWLIVVLLVTSHPLCAKPLKVLVIGGPAGGYATLPDGMLAEMLNRAYGWDTRYTQFFTKLDDSVVWRQLGSKDDLQRQSFNDILHLLNDWQPDVTVARLPGKQVDAMTAEIQHALIDRVSNGMGLVVWAQSHGGVDMKGEPLESVLPGQGFGGDYTGGILGPDWKWAAHRIVFGLPMDQLAPEMFFAVTGNASDYQAIDLTSSPSGRIRVRESGKGRVAMMGHTTNFGLGVVSLPQNIPGYSANLWNDRPDWGEIDLRLIGRIVMWAAGDRPSERIALNIPPLPTTLQPGAAQPVTVQILNETGAPVKADAWTKIGQGAPIRIGSVAAPPGQSEQVLPVTFPASSVGKWIPLEISLRDADGDIGSPPAHALRYFKIPLPIQIHLACDKPGVARGESVNVTASIDQPIPAGDVNLLWTVNDYQRRVLAAAVTPLHHDSTGQATATFRWEMPDLDLKNYRYQIRATVRSAKANLGDAAITITRREPYSLAEGIYHGVWTDIGSYPEALVPAWLDLYEDAGYHGLMTTISPHQVHYQEERNWRGYFEAFGSNEFADWALLSDDEALALARKDVATLLPRAPIVNTGAFPVLSLGEEATLTVNGSSVVDIHDPKTIPPAKYTAIYNGYLAYLHRVYGTLDKLNEQWEKSYHSWNDVEMPWNYFNFYYPDQQRPVKGVRNISQVVDQAGYMCEVWQRAYDAHTRALREINPMIRTMMSTGDFYNVHPDIPSSIDKGHTFRLEWAFFDDISRTQSQFGDFLINGGSMVAYWFDIPLVFNPDLTHTRATMYRRYEMKRALERAPLLLQAQGVPADPEVAVMRPSTPYNGELYNLLINNDPNRFLPTAPEAVWQKLLHISGVSSSSALTEKTRLLVLPLAVAVSPEMSGKLSDFLRNGGTLLTSCGLAEYNGRGKPYEEYPGAGLTDLLGLKLAKNYTAPGALRWTLTDWPTAPIPHLGTLYSTGRDTIVSRAADVKVLGQYQDGAPALLARNIGKGRVLFYNGVYVIPYTFSVDLQPYWPNMGEFVAALLDLSGIKPTTNIVDGNGQPIDELMWNLAGAGTNAPTNGDVVYVRVVGSLDSKPCKIVTTLPVAMARDALTGRPLEVARNGGISTIAFDRVPDAAHYIALLPYRLSRMTLQADATAVAGSLLKVHVAIFDDAGKPATGHHAVSLRAVLGGHTVTEQGEITGSGDIVLPIAVSDSGAVAIEAIDWTGGLRATMTVRVQPSRLAAQLPAPLPQPRAGMASHELSSEELVSAFNRLAEVYARDPSKFTSGSEAKWRLGYYTFLEEDSRHAIVERHLAPSSWNSQALRVALEHGAHWILTGEDVGIDPLQGQHLSPFDHLEQLRVALQGAQAVNGVAGSPDQLVYTFAGGGSLLLDRRSFDYWSGDDTSTVTLDWNGTNVVSRTGSGHFGGDDQQYTDAFRQWWRAAQNRGLLGDAGKSRGLIPLAKGFDLANWWVHGFGAKERQSVLDATGKLNLPPDSWQPPAQLDGYRLGALLFEDNFAHENKKWSFESGSWHWEKGHLAQYYSWRALQEGSPWGGRATLPDVADPQKSPILIAATGRIIGGYGYGSLGVGGGAIANDTTAGLQVMVQGSNVSAGEPNHLLKNQIPVTQVLNSPTDDIQFVLLLDGNKLFAKVWNWGAQREPAQWQLVGVIDQAKLGKALLLNSNIFCYWKNVRVWGLDRAG